MERHKAGKAEQYFEQHRNEYGKNIICSNRHKVRQMAIKGNIVGNGFKTSEPAMKGLLFRLYGYVYGKYL